MHRSTPVEVAEAIHQLEAAEYWRLDLYGGSVDYDTTTLMIIPRDGSQPYHLSEVGGHSGSINRKTDGSGANYLYIASTARPGRGGSVAQVDRRRLARPRWDTPAASAQRLDTR